ncbi:MAG: DUF4147 domain-containing protein [Anaerolineales bacterium]|nr:DUF4147 domain-containing protein [Anaerolineales bacterium]
MITLVLSDVVGNPLDVIASGPTVPDASTWQDAWAVVAKYDLASSLPAAVIARLESGRSSRLAETPKQGDIIFDTVQTVVVGDNRVAAEAACARAEALGAHALLLSTFVEGEAGTIGKVAVALGQGGGRKRSAGIRTGLPCVWRRNNRHARRSARTRWAQPGSGIGGSSCVERRAAHHGRCPCHRRQ